MQKNLSNLAMFVFEQKILIITFMVSFTYHNPNLGLVTKAKGCKVAGQKGKLGVMQHVPGSAREFEGIDPHTPKGTPTFGN
jgi:hypothetical protein